MTENRLKEIEARAYEIKEEIQQCINKGNYNKMIKLTKEFKSLVFELKQAKS